MERWRWINSDFQSLSRLQISREEDETRKAEFQQLQRTVTEQQDEVGASRSAVHSLQKQVRPTAERPSNQRGNCPCLHVSSVRKRQFQQIGLEEKCIMLND